MSDVLVERPHPAVAVLRLNRPRARNALSLALRRLLVAHLAEADADPHVRCIILAGSEQAFSAGADLTEMPPDLTPAEMMLRETERLWGAVAGVRKPLVAAVRGVAFGGGCELALHADIVVAGEGARFGLPEVKVGLMPGAGGTQRLPRLCGPQRALLPLLTGDPITAPEALALGMVSRLVPDDAVEAEALSIATAIAGRAPLAVRQIKEAVHRGLDGPLETGLALERKALQMLFSTADRAEGVAAFLEKRPPRFEGR